MEAGAYIAGSVSIACVAVLFFMGNNVARIAIALIACLVVGAYALFFAYASGYLAYLVERFG
jgi:hypothetical protein